MAFLFKKEQPKPAPGFHAIDISGLVTPPKASDPDKAQQLDGNTEEIMAAIRMQTGLRMLRARRTAQGLREVKVQASAATFLQSFARSAATRTDLARRQKKALEETALRHTAASMIQEQYRQNRPAEVGAGGEASSSSGAEGAMPAADAFVIKNLDTGEAVSVELGPGDTPGKDLKLSFGTLQQNPQAWEALKADSKGAPTPCTVSPPASPCTAPPPPHAPRAPPPAHAPRATSATASRLAAQDCWRSSRPPLRSPSARISSASGRSDTFTPLTTRFAISTSPRTCSRQAARRAYRTLRSSSSVRATA